MEKLGIEPSLLLTQIINFVILLFVLTKLLYKPILKALDDRKRKIEEGLEFTQKAKKEEEQLELKHQEVLKRANEEAKEIIEAARSDGRKLKEEIISSGKEEIATLKKKLEKELKVKEEETAAEITSHTVEIASEMVKKLIPDLMTGENQHKLIVRELTRLEKSHDKK